MSASEIFHYPFYMRLILNYEKPQAGFVKLAKDNVYIPDCVLLYLKSEELLSFSLVSSRSYDASLKELQTRIKPLETEYKLMQIRLHFSLFSSDGLVSIAYPRVCKFAASTPILGLMNPAAAALEFERQLIQTPNLLMKGYRKAIEDMFC